MDNRGISSIVHGDLVFSNIFYNQDKVIKFIDPRGAIGNDRSIYGDKIYDYAKIYQSLTGYEHLVSSKKNYKDNYFQNLKNHFEEWFITKFSEEYLQDLKFITASLYISLIPLHDTANHEKFFKRAKNIIKPT